VGPLITGLGHWTIVIYRRVTVGVWCSGGGGRTMRGTREKIINKKKNMDTKAFEEIGIVDFDFVHAS
jgi:hypothetical protein